MAFTLWGDEIAYEHQVIGRLLIGATTLRDRVETDLLAADAEEIERQVEAARQEVHDEYTDAIEESDTRIKELETEVAKLERTIDAIEGGQTIEQLRAELAVAEQAARDWRKRAEGLEPPKRRRKSRA